MDWYSNRDEPKTMALSDRQPDPFHNPANALWRDGNLRVLGEAAYRRFERLVTMSEGKRDSCPPPLRPS
jgi:hypothetical protein